MKNSTLSKNNVDVSNSLFLSMMKIQTCNCYRIRLLQLRCSAHMQDVVYILCLLETVYSEVFLDKK